MSCLRESSGKVLLDVFVQPKSSRNSIEGIHDRELKIRLTAPPVEGQANKACLNFLSKQLSIPKRCMAIAAGQKSRHKTVAIADFSFDEVGKRLKDLTVS